MRFETRLGWLVLWVGLWANACDGASEGGRGDVGADGIASSDAWSFEQDVTVPDTSGLDTLTASDTTADTKTGTDWTVDDSAMGIDTGAADTSGPPPAGGLCQGPCDSHEMCGGSYDMCIRNNQTQETFCSQYCTSQGMCPSGFQCVAVSGLGQCVPIAGSCGGVSPPPTCDPACPSGEVCVNGQCVEGGQWEAELQRCVDVINDYRAQHGRSQLQRSAAVEACAMEGAAEDAATGQPHGHFQRTGGCGGTAYAENEVPGWPLAMYGSVMNVVEQGAASMMAEGPGGGHYENILRSSHTAVGCGIFVTDSNEVWVVQNFR